MQDFVDYCLEAHGMATYGNEDGFVQYRLPRVEKDNNGIVLDIQRIYVKRDKRGNKAAAKMVDELVDKLKPDLESKNLKLRRLVGYIHQNDTSKEASLIVQLKYGFKIAKLNDGNIILVKEL